jgi:hypothetical protein
MSPLHPFRSCFSISCLESSLQLCPRHQGTLDVAREGRAPGRDEHRDGITTRLIDPERTRVKIGEEAFDPNDEREMVEMIDMASPFASSGSARLASDDPRE